MGAIIEDKSVAEEGDFAEFTFSNSTSQQEKKSIQFHWPEK